MHELEFTFDRRLIYTAMRRDVVWRLWLPPVVGGLLCGWLYYLQGSIGSMFIWVAGSLTAVEIFLLVMIRVSIVRTDQLWSTQAPDRRMRFSFDDEGFDVLLGESKTRYAWTSLKQLWRYPDVWLLEVVRMMSVFFPADAATPEVRAYISERCQAANIKVKP